MPPTIRTGLAMFSVSGAALRQLVGQAWLGARAHAWQTAQLTPVEGSRELGPDESSVERAWPRFRLAPQLSSHRSAECRALTPPKSASAVDNRSSLNQLIVTGLCAIRLTKDRLRTRRGRYSATRTLCPCRLKVSFIWGLTVPTTITPPGAALPGAVRRAAGIHDLRTAVYVPVDPPQPPRALQYHRVHLHRLLCTLHGAPEKTRLTPKTLKPYALTPRRKPSIALTTKTLVWCLGGRSEAAAYPPALTPVSPRNPPPPCSVVVHILSMDFDGSFCCPA